MSDGTKRTMTQLGLVIGIASGIAGLFGAWFVLPYRVQAAESAQREMQSQVQRDHDLLQRIDERTARMEKALDRMAR